MLAIQTEVSDGTLETINVGILYLERNDISVYLSTDPTTALVDGSDYEWTSDTSIHFLTGPVANGVSVRLVRTTDSDQMLNVYDGGGAFSRTTLDENFNQLLFLTQEFTEGVGLGNLQTTLNMNGNVIFNLGDGILPTDAINLGQLSLAISKVIRTPEVIPALPAAASRIGKLLGFDAGGNPVPIAAASQSATELEMRLADGVDPENGSELVAHRSRTSREKLDDVISSMDTGAVGDGITADDALLASAKALTGGESPFLFSRLHKAVDPVDLTGVYVRGTYATGITSVDADRAVTLGDDTRIQGGRYHSSTGPVMRTFASGSENIDIMGADILCDSAANAHGINLSTDGAKNIKVAFCDITTNSYGILTNTPGSNIDGLTLAFNGVRSELADAMEFNAPGVIHKNIVAVGNICAAGAAGTGVNAGFTYGAAAIKNLLLLGNVSTESRQEAIHIEDDHQLHVVSSNILDECGENAVRILQGGLGLATDADGVVVVGNAAKAKAGNVDAGYRMVWDAFDSVKASAIVANRAKGFAEGFRTGNKDVILSGNVSQNCATHLSVDGRGMVHGQNLAVDCQTLVKTILGTVVDKQKSSSILTTVLDTTAHPANTVGTILKGFQMPVTPVITVASGTWVQPLVTIPLRAVGKLRCIVRAVAAADFLMVSGDIHWDGTTLTVTNIIKHNSGIFGGSPTFTAAGGNINLSVFTGAAVLPPSVYVDFDGDYYK